MALTASKTHSRKRPSRVATIKAQDENGSLEIKVSFSSKTLTRSETDMVVRHATRILSSALAGLPYTDYGIDNTTIKL